MVEVEILLFLILSIVDALDGEIYCIQKHNKMPYPANILQTLRCIVNVY